MKAEPTNPLLWFLSRVLALLASLKLTIVLLTLSMYLIFVGTLAQVENGIWQVVNEYFRSKVVMVPFDVFRSLLYPGSETTWPGAHPFPGGFLIIGALVVNLIAAHAVRYKIRGKGSRLMLGWLLIAVGTAAAGFTVLEPQTSATIQQNVILMLAIWTLPMLLIGVGCVYVFGTQKAGIVIIHAGLILMLLGEYITGIGATEGMMSIPEFGSSNTIMDVREAEIAFVSEKENGNLQHVVIPQKTIVSAGKTEDKIEGRSLPLSVRVDEWMPNSMKIVDRLINDDPTQVVWAAKQVPEVTGTEMRQDQPAVMVTLFKGGERVGRHLLSTWPAIKPVELEVDGRVWQVSLRFKQIPLPYSLQLNDFRHDTFTGTRIARNFSSDLRLAADDLGDSRGVYIKMNQPLRYDRKAFFQSQFFSHPLNRNQGTILQIVDNPGAWVPYLSCVVVTLGLVMQFTLSLIKFGRRANAQAAAKNPKPAIA